MFPVHPSGLESRTAWLFSKCTTDPVQVQPSLFFSALLHRIRRVTSVNKRKSCSRTRRLFFTDWRENRRADSSPRAFGFTLIAWIRFTPRPSAIDGGAISRELLGVMARGGAAAAALMAIIARIRKAIGKLTTLLPEYQAVGPSIASISNRTREEYARTVWMGTYSPNRRWEYQKAEEKAWPRRTIYSRINLHGNAPPSHT